MSNRALITALRLALALALALGLLSSPVGNSDSHNPAALAVAKTAKHAELAMQVDAHSHDDADYDEQERGHSHGHNPADHSHGTAGALACFDQPTARTSRTWLASPHLFASVEASFRLERPPRPIVIV